MFPRRRRRANARVGYGPACRCGLRNGSQTSSTVSGSSADRDGERGQRPTGPLPNSRSSASSTRQVEPVKPQLVDLVDGKGRPRDALVNDAVTSHLTEVAHPAQQPAGDARRATGTTGDLGALRFRPRSVDAEQRRGSPEHLLELPG